MFNRDFVRIFSYLTFLILLLSSRNHAQCPTIGNLLNHGYVAIPPEHIPHEGGNYDEFGITDPSPFIIKVNNYPPVKAWPITKSCGSAYYFSFDTDGQNFPINHNLPYHQPNSVKTYRIDQDGNYVGGTLL